MNVRYRYLSGLAEVSTRPRVDFLRNHLRLDNSQSGLKFYPSLRLQRVCDLGYLLSLFLWLLGSFGKFTSSSARADSTTPLRTWASQPSYPQPRKMTYPHADAWKGQTCLITSLHLTSSSHASLARFFSSLLYLTTRSLPHNKSPATRRPAAAVF